MSFRNLFLASVVVLGVTVLSGCQCFQKKSCCGSNTTASSYGEPCCGGSPAIQAYAPPPAPTPGCCGR